MSFLRRKQEGWSTGRLEQTDLGVLHGLWGIQREVSCFQGVKNLQPGPGHLDSSPSPATSYPHNSMTAFSEPQFLQLENPD